ncbi:MAG: aldehyde dehydrogenase (NADP(+)), partial [Kiritimatiellae bacterium]|nr:aldehyde dehydrogenase (NADP(+)) [Kiritimatiellia bacterium]
DREGFAWSNTLLQVNGGQFLGAPEVFQCEAFGNATLVVVLDDADQWVDAIARCEGSLTGSIYSAGDGSEDALYDQIAPALRARVGRLLNDKMPTGVAVSPAMQHGGPFPASGHPHFTAVGFPASLRRFTMLASYDNVRAHRLPPVLQDPA